MFSPPQQSCLIISGCKIFGKEHLLWLTTAEFSQPLADTAVQHHYYPFCDKAVSPGYSLAFWIYS